MGHGNYPPTPLDESTGEEGVPAPGVRARTVWKRSTEMGPGHHTKHPAVMIFWALQPQKSYVILCRGEGREEGKAVIIKPLDLLLHRWG